MDDVEHCTEVQPLGKKYKVYKKISLIVYAIYEFHHFLQKVLMNVPELPGAAALFLDNMIVFDTLMSAEVLSGHPV